MTLNPTLADIALRILLACAAGFVVGFNRERRNQAAGLRTTILVTLAACLAMVLANRLLPTMGKHEGAFAQIDVLRLPLGILSGMGFLGAGSIIRRGDVVQGVTTAATLWFMSVVGLCFGAGELALGAAATAIAFACVWGLKWLDHHMPRRQRAVLSVSADRARLGEDGLRRRLEAAGFAIRSWAIAYLDGGARYELRADLEWRGGARERARHPPVLEEIGLDPAVAKADWRPEALSG